VEQSLRLIEPKGRSAIRLANLGSGGIAFGPSRWLQIHVDLSVLDLQNVRFGAVGDIRYLPLADQSVDAALCVGQVLNLTDPRAAIPEIARVLRRGALVVLEFESNASLEFFPRRVEPETVVSTFFNERSVTITLLDPSYIRGLMAGFGFEVLSSTSFQILSSLVLRITGSRRFAARFAVFDPVLRRLPFLRGAGCNYLLVARRL